MKQALSFVSVSVFVLAAQRVAHAVDTVDSLSSKNLRGLSNIFESENDQPSDPPRQLSGRVILKRKTHKELQNNGKSEAEINKIRAQGMSEIKKNKIVFESRGLDFQVIEVGANAEEAFIKKLMAGANAGLFEYAEPDYIEYPVTTVPDDTYLPQSWQHSVMESTKAWDTTTGSDTIVVAICDTGLQPNHPDLEDNRVEGYNASTRQWEKSGGIVDNVHPHGTMCAGSAAAIGNNNEGAVGVGWNFKHRPMRVSEDSNGGASSSVLAHCAETACAAGDKVVSVSYSGVTGAARRNAATFCKAQGSLMFNAAGNDNTNLQGSADDDDLIVVGATDVYDARSSFSNYGNFVDVMAPGSSIVTTSTDNSYQYASGTSFSCPITAGLAALIWSAKPSLTPDEVEQVLKESADDLGAAGYDSQFAHGRINSYKAMQHPLVTGTSFTSSTVSGPSPITTTTVSGPSPITTTTTPAPPSDCGQYSKKNRCNSAGGCQWVGRGRGGNCDNA